MNLLLLRGLSREVGHWGDFPGQLQAALPGSRVLAVDLPGAGTRAEEASPLTIREMVQAVRHSLPEAQAPWHLVALSLGGMVALDWAHAAPEEVASVVLINSSSSLSPLWQRLQPAAWWDVAAALASADIEARERRILQLTSNQPVAAKQVDEWIEIQHQRPVRRATVVRQLLAARAFRPEPHAPVCPGLVLASEGDRIVDWQCSQRLAQQYGWLLRRHPTAGHDLPLDDPAWVCAEIAAWYQAQRLLS